MEKITKSLSQALGLTLLMAVLAVLAVLAVGISVYFGFFASTTQASGCSPQIFTDVNACSPEHEEISFVKSQGVVRGYPDGSYRPQAQITRAEFLKIAMGGFAGECKENFNDSLNAWYSPFTCAAKTSGLVVGYTDGTFKPNQTITQGEALAIVYRITLKPQSISEDARLIPDFKYDINLTRGQMATVFYRMSQDRRRKP